MKRLLLTVIASLALCGSIFAQSQVTESHWPDFNYHAYDNHFTLVAFIQIDGNYVAIDGNWEFLEMAAFVDDVCRGTQVMIYDGDDYPIVDDMSIYYDNPDEPLTFGLYDHSTGQSYVSSSIFRMGTPGETLTLLTGPDDHVELYFDYDEAIVINFTAAGLTKDITAYDGNGGWYFIASPVNENITPSAENGFLTEEYDLYYFDQEGDTEGNEWINHKDATLGGFAIENGKGYLYASSTNTTLTFTGTPYEGDGVVELAYSETGGSDNMRGWNLVGNPFAQTATIDVPFYTLDGDEDYQEHAAGDEIEAMQGVLVKVTEATALTFSTTAKVKSANLALNVSKDNRLIDRAILSFGHGSALPKFQLNPNHTKIYMPVEGNDYAVVYTESMGEMPVSFKAEKNGTYSLSFNAEEVSFAYLHLIDNMTGDDTDLLANPNYSFEAKTTDYANRFKLVFATGDNGSDDSFAFFSNGSFIITNDGEATLQVVDVMGRIISSETINGNANVNVNAAPGVYMLRLVNGDNVKVQKVVVR